MKAIIEKIKNNIEKETVHACSRNDTYMGFDTCDCCGYSDEYGDKDRYGIEMRVSVYKESGYRICPNCLVLYIREGGDRNILDNLYNSPNLTHRQQWTHEELDKKMKFALQQYIWEASGGRCEERMEMINRENKKIKFNITGEAYQTGGKWVYDIFYNGKIIKAQGAEQKLKWARNQAMLDMFKKALEQGYYPAEFYKDMKIINKEGRKRG
ncbi:MAG: hypothetical protein K2M30_02625 [Desulfovibrionaceae bacterium]|nr:hypothetical protein [Desulfovibrionaceae bacterium]